jgi:hypothetical protein
MTFITSPSHPWTLDHFRETRQDQYNYTADVIYSGDSRFKVVRAPVKSGKRSFPEIASLIKPSCVHLFVSALNRKADKQQHDELEKYGIFVHLTYNKKTADTCVESVMNLVNDGKEVHIHLDELDYGCKHDQVLSGVYFRLKDEEKVKFILYSATIDVVRTDFLDDEIRGFAVVLPPFSPASAYYGVNNYIEDKKLIQSTAFVEFSMGKMVITDQGKECLGKLLDDTFNPLKKQHIGVLRLSGKQGKVPDFRLFKNQVQVVEDYAREYIKSNVARDENYDRRMVNGMKVIFVSSADTTIKWDDSDYWSRFLVADVPYLIVICQVAGRSTEWKCHPYLSWFHTCRSKTTSASTQIQDQERVVFYDTEYNTGTDIILYGNEYCALYSANLITTDEMMQMTNKKLSLTLNGKCSNSFKVVMKSPEVYDQWEDIPEKVVLKLKLKKEDFINDRMTLQKQMKYTKQKNGINLHYIVEVPDWSGEDEGMYMTDIRGSVNNFMEWCVQRENGNPAKSSKERRPVWHRTDMMKSLSAGMNKTHPLRVNLFYEDGETNPDNYKFMVREIDRTEPALFKNNSMYNFCE